MVRYLESTEDVLQKWLEWSETEIAAIVIVTDTEGGAVRAPGAMMAVSRDGERAGYISGGCIDADVVTQSQAALESGEIKILRYGRNSPFIDLPLPCGGSIEIMILPNPRHDLVKQYCAKLRRREAVTIYVSKTGFTDHNQVYDSSSPYDFNENDHSKRYVYSFRLVPKPRLRIAGKGADCIALAKLAHGMGIETQLQLIDPHDISEAKNLGIENISSLSSPNDCATIKDDAWTAFLLAFHDAHWELELLAHAISGPAFYVGAVGSKRTQTRRYEHLSDLGVNECQINRIRGPVGLIPSMRDASMLAISIMAEIIEEYHVKKNSPFKNTALILLAAGQSSRFAEGDKLLANFRERRVLEYASDLLSGEKVAHRIAVIGPDQSRRAAILRLKGWNVVVNTNAITGISSSIACAIEIAARDSATNAAIILLSDMPNISNEYLFNLRDELTPEKYAVFSKSSDVVTPPAIIRKYFFPQINSLTGDVGMKHLLNTIENYNFTPINDYQKHDIDVVDDLHR